MKQSPIFWYSISFLFESTFESDFYEWYLKVNNYYNYVMHQILHWLYPFIIIILLQMSVMRDNFFCILLLFFFSVFKAFENFFLHLLGLTHVGDGCFRVKQTKITSSSASIAINNTFIVTKTFPWWCFYQRNWKRCDNSW